MKKKEGIQMKKTMFAIVGLSVLLFLGGCGTTNETTTESSSNKEAKEVVFYITRHGKTMLNQLDRVQGWADSPLVADGQEVAGYLGKGLLKENVQFDAVYTSDLDRAEETAQIVLDEMNSELKIHTDKGLREACYGMFEGNENAVMMSAVLEENKMTDPSELSDLGLGMWKLSADTLAKIDELDMAESSDVILKRMKESMTHIAKEVETNGGGDVLVVGHGMSIAMLLGEWTEQEFAGHLDNASVSKVTYKNGEFTVESIGDTSYIEIGKKN